MAETKIEWADSTWNPIVARRLEDGKIGWHCEKVSPACAHCYAEAMNKRNLPGRGTGLPYDRRSRDQVEIEVHEPTLIKPYGWKRPRKIFVCSMTDLFGHFVPFGLIDRVFAAIYNCQWHTFQLLTKRTRRARDYLTHPTTPFRIATHAWELLRNLSPEKAEVVTARDIEGDIRDSWPLPNAWIGATVENQEWADKRLPSLLKCPAAVRFLSCEPLLGPVNLNRRACVDDGRVVNFVDPLSGRYSFNGRDQFGGPSVDWVIVGGESGPHARPMRPLWATSIRDQCKAAGVPFFFKQMGEWVSEFHPASDVHRHPSSDAFVEILYDGAGKRSDYRGEYMFRVGKAAAGRLLDGVEYNEFPEVARCR